MQNIILLISNTIRVIAFVILAIYFEKWWIALFAGLFLAYFKDEKEDKDNVGDV